MFSRRGNTYHWVCVSRLGEHICLGMCFLVRGIHISRICVFQVGEQVVVGIGHVP